ncbi:MAG: ABC transporter ATP-binding protein, partial [Eggerthella lenta]
MEAVVEPAIKTKKLSKVFGNRRAVDNVSIEVPQGAFLSIFGPNGAGKTTLLRVLSTLSRATSGSATLMGVDLKEDPDKARDHIGLISHNSMLYPDLTAEQNLMIYARLYGVVDPEARVLELLEAVELKHRRLDVVRTFSRGMTQRLSIARALIHDPDVVFLDEPYSGLDPHAVEI